MVASPFKKKRKHYATLNKLSRLTITGTTESLVDIQWLAHLNM